MNVEAGTNPDYSGGRGTRTKETHHQCSELIMKAWTYITTNAHNSVLYTGLTSNLKSRMDSHKTKKYPGSFTARYNAYKLVWYQEFNSIIDAREREKQLKAGSRKKKLALINKMNPEWEDLTIKVQGG